MAIENVTFTLSIDSGNAALIDSPYHEVSRLLRAAARQIEDSRLDGKLVDSNGSTVGEFELELEEADEDEDDEDNTDDQDEAEAICSNDEHLYNVALTGSVEDLEFALRAWCDRQRIETFDPDKVDFAALSKFIND